MGVIIVFNRVMNSYRPKSSKNGGFGPLKAFKTMFITFISHKKILLDKSYVNYVEKSHKPWHRSLPIFLLHVLFILFLYNK